MPRSVFLLLLVHVAFAIHGQGTLLSQKKIDPETFDYWPGISTGGRPDPAYAFLDNLEFYEITYLSDGLKVKGYMVIPKQLGKLPVVIFNRGGNRDFHMMTTETLVEWIAPVAREGYLVIASQYRGSAGSEGTEEFGGKDVNDVLNLLQVINELPNADTTRIGMYGWSRGGIMTYLALARTNRIKAAVVGGAPTDLLAELESRPEMENVYSALIPGYSGNKTAELQNRSVSYWPEKLCPSTPLLIIHGKSDPRVSYTQAEILATQLSDLGHKHELVLYEDDDHIISQNRKAKDKKVSDWLQLHLK